jgi:hypothetical protein
MALRRSALIFAGLICAGFAVLVWQAGRWLNVPGPTGSGPAPVIQSGTKRVNPFLPSDVPDRGWPFIRGPARDGRSPEVHLADRWPDAGPPVLWHRALGQGYSALTAAGDRVFTQYQSLSGQYVVCLDAETGETIWEYRYDWPYEAGGMYPGPRATPTIEGDRIVFAAPSGLVGCLDWVGQLIWSVDTRKKFSGRGADFGYSCSPTVTDGLVLLPVGGPGAALVALDLRDGSTKWQAGDDSASYTPALPISVNGRKLVVAYLENVLACFDQQRGELLWRIELSQGYDEHAAWPIYVEPNLWISAPFRWGSSVLKLSATDGEIPEAVWHTNRLANDVFSSVYDQGSLYGFDLKDVQAKSHRSSRGVFRCIDFLTGREQWETDQTGHAAVLVADGKLLLFNDQGELILARASAESYEELSRASVLAGEICWTPPALDRGRVYVRNQRQAACLFVGERDYLEDHPQRALVTVAEIPQGQYRNLATILGVEPEYAFDVPSPAWLSRWYRIGLGVLGVAALFSGFVQVAVRLAIHKPLGAATGWRLFRVSGFLLGAFAMTPLSLHYGEFVFTWPVSLFVAFQGTVQHLPLRRTSALDSKLSKTSTLAALAFVAICFIYYLLCRRLSLAFEWVFLSGFAAALPFTFLGRWIAQRPNALKIIASLACTACEFSAYYWGSILLLCWKYPGAADPH